MRYLITFLTILTCITLHAEIKITASAPEVVTQGEQFNLEYEINTQNIKSVQRLNKIPGFTILYGPSTSSYSSIQIINGKQSSVSAITYTYTLSAEKAGEFKLPKISANIGGETYTSNSPSIKVLAGSAPSASSSRGNSSSSAIDSKSTSEHISNKDLFITVTANKSQVYEQEPIMLTYKVYTRLNLTQLSGKMPDLKGFMVKEIPLPGQKSFSIESYGGQNYYTTVWSQYMMFPQQTGKLAIPEIKFEGVVVFADPTIDLLDEFFNGHSSQIQRKKTVISPSLNIIVKPLPEKPKDFSGAVGNFSIKASVKTPKPKQNETLNLQFKITGVGNVDLIKAPTLPLSDDFELYPPKQKAESSITTAGMNGTMTIDYVLVPKIKGKYTIPAISFTYFDTSSQEYKTLTTTPIELQIAKGEKNIYADQQREILAKNDIRHIKTGSIRLRNSHDNFFNHLHYWLLYLLFLVIFVLIVVYIRHRDNLSQDMEGQRIRKAGKAVSQHLSTARQMLKLNQKDKFYDSLSHAMMDYAASKLSLSVSSLSKESIAQGFSLRGVSESLIQQFIHLQEDCELYQFSHTPIQGKDEQTIFNECARLITDIDTSIKKYKKNKQRHD